MSTVKDHHWTEVVAHDTSYQLVSWANCREPIVTDVTLIAQRMLKYGCVSESSHTPGSRESQNHLQGHEGYIFICLRKTKT